MCFLFRLDLSLRTYVGIFFGILIFETKHGASPAFRLRVCIRGSGLDEGNVTADTRQAMGMVKKKSLTTSQII